MPTTGDTEFGPGSTWDLERAVGRHLARPALPSRVTNSALPADAGDEYTWLIETSDEGQTWWPERHPVYGDRDTGGIERAATAEDLAHTVLDRRFRALRWDEVYDWDDLWFRVTVWNHHAASDGAGWQQPPYPPDQAGQTPHHYGRYLQHHQVEPYAVEVRTPRQVRAAVLAVRQDHSDAAYW